MKPRITIKKEEYISKSQIRRDYGFTDKMCYELLSDPMLAPNPKHKSGKPMKLYSLSEVKKVVNTNRYKEMLNEYERDKALYIENNKEAYDKMLEELNEKIRSIRVKRTENVCYQALLNKAEYEQSRYNFVSVTDLEFSKQETINRWAVNYVRHNLTEYDEALFETKSNIEVGMKDFYCTYKCAVLSEIGKVYPELRSECNHQIKQAKMFV